MQHAAAQLSGSRFCDLRMNHHPLQAKPLCGWPELSHQFQEFLRLLLQRGPNIEQYPVPGQALMGGQVGLVQANTLQRLHQHAFEMGDLDDLAGFVP